MEPSGFVHILEQMQSNGFREISGARLAADLPVPARLVNELVAASLPLNAPVREVHIHPEAGDQFSVRIFPKAAFLPHLKLMLGIERQPEFPGHPVLVLRALGYRVTASRAGQKRAYALAERELLRGSDTWSVA